MKLEKYLVDLRLLAPDLVLCGLPVLFLLDFVGS